MNIYYTIIIPHHNIPDLLERCLKSIPQRSDIQIIVVDDNSEDNYKEMLSLLEKAFPHVQFIYSENPGGGGKARNIGIDHAIGKYLVFADADDFFTSDFDRILDDYRSKEFDISFFKGTSCDTKTYKETHRADHLNKYIDDYIEKKDSNANNLRFLFGEPWCKIIRRDIIVKNNILFDETKIHNDTTFAYLVGYYANNVIVDIRPLYCVTTREGSVSVTNSDDRILTRVQVYGRAERFFKEKRLPVTMDEQYVQLVRLLVHGRISLFRRCKSILTELGFSGSHVYIKTLKTFFSIISTRI